MERSGEEVVKEGQDEEKWRGSGKGRYCKDGEKWRGSGKGRYCKDGERERDTHREMQIKTYQQQG